MDHLADAPIANLLILAGVIFLAVGIFGRVGGFVGKIFGNIEAGGNSRVLAGILGVLLTIGGGWLHHDGDKSAAKPSEPASTTTQPAATQPATPAQPSSSANTVSAGMATPPAQPNAGHYTAPANPASTPAGERKALPTHSDTKAEKATAPSTPPPVNEIDERLIGTWTNALLRST